MSDWEEFEPDQGSKVSDHISAAELESLSAREERDLVILVHGTAAADESDTGIKWWQRGSEFITKMNERLGDRVSFGPDERKTFHWSGANSERERRAAGCDLLDRLEELERDGRNYHIIGHSHGGSVAWHALTEAVKRKTDLPHLHSLMTIGTPFLRFRPDLSHFFALIPMILSALGLFFLGFWLHETIPPRPNAEAAITAEYLLANFQILWDNLGSSVGWLTVLVVLLLVLIFILTFLFGLVKPIIGLARHRTWSRKFSRATKIFDDRWTGLASGDDEAINTIAASMAAGKDRIATITESSGEGTSASQSRWGPEGTIPAYKSWLQHPKIRKVVRPFNGLVFLVLKIMWPLLAFARGTRKFARWFLKRVINPFYIDAMIWGTTSKNIQGNDVGGQKLVHVTRSPRLEDHYDTRIDESLDEDLADYADHYAFNLIRSLRRQIGFVAAGAMRPMEILSQVQDQMTWQELVHNAYLKHEETLGLIADTLEARLSGEQPRRFKESQSKDSWPVRFKKLRDVPEASQNPRRTFRIALVLGTTLVCSSVVGPALFLIYVSVDDLFLTTQRLDVVETVPVAYIQQMTEEEQQNELDAFRTVYRNSVSADTDIEDRVFLASVVRASGLRGTARFRAYREMFLVETDVEAAKEGRGNGNLARYQCNAGFLLRFSSGASGGESEDLGRAIHNADRLKTWIQKSWRSVGEGELRERVNATMATPVEERACFLFYATYISAIEVRDPILRALLILMVAEDGRKVIGSIEQRLLARDSLMLINSSNSRIGDIKSRRDLEKIWFILGRILQSDVWPDPFEHELEEGVIRNVVSIFDALTDIRQYAKYGTGRFEAHLPEWMDPSSASHAAKPTWFYEKLAKCIGINGQEQTDPCEIEGRERYSDLKIGENDVQPINAMRMTAFQSVLLWSLVNKDLLILNKWNYEKDATGGAGRVVSDLQQIADDFRGVVLQHFEYFSQSIGKDRTVSLIALQIAYEIDVGLAESLIDSNLPDVAAFGRKWRENGIFGNRDWRRSGDLGILLGDIADSNITWARAEHACENDEVSVAQQIEQLARLEAGLSLAPKLEGYEMAIASLESMTCAPLAIWLTRRDLFIGMNDAEFVAEMSAEGAVWQAWRFIKLMGDSDVLNIDEIRVLLDVLFSSISPRADESRKVLLKEIGRIDKDIKIFGEHFLTRYYFYLLEENNRVPAKLPPASDCEGCGSTNRQLLFAAMLQDDVSRSPAIQVLEHEPWIKIPIDDPADMVTIFQFYSSVFAKSCQVSASPGISQELREILQVHAEVETDDDQLRSCWDYRINQTSKTAESWLGKEDHGIRGEDLFLARYLRDEPFFPAYMNRVVADSNLELPNPDSPIDEIVYWTSELAAVGSITSNRKLAEIVDMHRERIETHYRNNAPRFAKDFLKGRTISAEAVEMLALMGVKFYTAMEMFISDARRPLGDDEKSHLLKLIEMLPSTIDTADEAVIRARWLEGFLRIYLDALHEGNVDASMDRLRALQQHTESVLFPEGSEWLADGTTLEDGTDSRNGSDEKTARIDGLWLKVLGEEPNLVESSATSRTLDSSFSDYVLSSIVQELIDTLPNTSGRIDELIRVTALQFIKHGDGKRFVRALARLDNVEARWDIRAALDARSQFDKKFIEECLKEQEDRKRSRGDGLISGLRHWIESRPSPVGEGGDGKCKIDFYEQALAELKKETVDPGLHAQFIAYSSLLSDETGMAFWTKVSRDAPERPVVSEIPTVLEILPRTTMGSWVGEKWSELSGSIRLYSRSRMDPIRLSDQIASIEELAKDISIDEERTNAMRCVADLRVRNGDPYGAWKGCQSCRSRDRLSLSGRLAGALLQESTRDRSEDSEEDKSPDNRQVGESGSTDSQSQQPARLGTNSLEIDFRVAAAFQSTFARLIEKNGQSLENCRIIQ